MTSQDVLSLIVGFALVALAWAVENWRWIAVFVAAALVLHALSWISYQLARVEAELREAKSDTKHESLISELQELRTVMEEIRDNVDHQPALAASPDWTPALDSIKHVLEDSRNVLEEIRDELQGSDSDLDVAT